MTAHMGEISSFITVICWVVCSMSFEAAGKKIGSMSVNLIRMPLAFLLISITTFFSRGLVLPTDATPEAWLWLSISGIIGFFIGDLCLFRAFIEVGSRISMLIYSLAPPITALMGYLVFGEEMTVYGIIGMFVTMGGISLVILKRSGGKVQVNHPIKGVILALLGTLGQVFGVVFSKMGMNTQDGIVYDQFASSQIRIISSTICFILLFTITKRWGSIKKAFTFKKSIAQVSLGALFGPYLGVTMGLYAITYTTFGIYSTIVATVPVVIILPHVLIYKEKIELREILGAFIAVIGVSMLFMEDIIQFFHQIF